MNRAWKLLNLASVLILICSALVIWQTNRQTRFCSDDYLYSHKFDPGFAGPNPSSVKYEKIDSLPDYVESLSRLYQTLTGRIVPHAILQVILLLPGWVFDLLNTLVLFALTYLYTTWIAGRKHPGRMALWLLATLLWYLAISQSKRNFYLPAFSINYVWTQSLLFLFLIPVRRLIQEEERGGGKGQALALLFYGIIVGATNEPAVPAVLMAMGIWGLLAFIRSPKSLPLWYYSGMTGLVLGFIFMFLAPGNSGRAVYESTHTGSGGIGFSLTNLRSILRDLAVSLPTICLGIWGIFSLNRQEFKERWRTYLFLLAALSGTLFALFFTPIYPNRVSILFVGYIIIIGLSLFTIKWGRKPVLLSLCLLLGLVPFGFRLMKDYQWAQHSEGEYQLFVKQIEACKLDSCLVNPRAYSEALTRDNWAKAVASYYGKDYIGVKSAFSEEQQAAWQLASYQQVGSSDLDLVGLSYVNHDPFTRTIYVILKTDEAGFAPDKAMIAVKTADLPDWAESLAWRIPRSILYNLLPSVIIHRPQELFVSNDYAIYSIAMPIEDGKDDILAIGLKEKGKTVGRLFLSEISFR